MESIIIPEKYKDASKVFEHIFNNTFGNPIIFQATPTSDTMKSNTWGYYSNTLYVKFNNGVLLKFTGTVVS